MTGGYVYRGAAYPALWGGYFFGDYCSGQVWALYQDAGGSWQRVEVLQSGVRISSFGEDEAGEVYVCALNTGVIYRLTATPR